MSEHPILEFWFGEISESGEVDPERQKRWWKKDPAFDDLCRERFEKELLALRAGQRDELRKTPRGALAFILLCDQIPRNIYRDRPEAFASDALALAATRELLATGREEELLPIERSFAFMPLMHSEDPEVQALSVQKFAELADEGYDTRRFATRHREIIDRFGRFPHRNAILNRKSSPEELEFLRQPGSSF